MYLTCSLPYVEVIGNLVLQTAEIVSLSIYHKNFGVENISFATIYFTFEIRSKYEFHMLKANKKETTFVCCISNEI